MKTMRQLISVLLITTFILSTASNAFAKQCVNSISGNANKTVTFTVNTDNKFRIGYDKITLTQRKGVMRYESYGSSMSTKTKETYTNYSVYCRSNKTGKVVKNNAYWTSQSMTIYLPERNSSYTVTVTPRPIGSSGLTYVGIFLGWNKVPTWCITKDRGISLYY